ncbi:MAG: hypothetical protein O2912_00200 [Proteobacteria bacterium]|nr:hypothetical protein [Pseudomonadota bacterium]
MATFAHTLSRTLPRPLSDWARPKWHLLQELWELYVRQHGSVSRDKELLCWVVKKPLLGGTLNAPARSFKEFRRITQFGVNPKDLVFHWINMIDDCEVLYDVGAANGHEGLIAHELHKCHVVYVEMFTPSIETILKGVVIASRQGGQASDFDVVAAAIDREERYAKVLLHNPPVAGGTYNTFDDVDAYCRGGRQGEAIWASQWSPSVSIDCLHKRHGIPKPTHVKMDVDGFEDRAIEGAAKTLESRHVRSWIIEISPGREASIHAAMEKAGYKDIAHFVHYEKIDDCEDHLFVRDDLVEEYEQRLVQIRERLSSKGH